MAATSFGCGYASSLAGSERPAMLKTTPFQALSSATLYFSHIGGGAAVAANGRRQRVEFCAVSYQPTGKPRGIMRPRRVSPAMQELVGLPEISRTDALKRIWAHIKQNNLQFALRCEAALQDPDDKRIIVCDEKLKNIFAGKDRVKFLEVAGLITPHFL